MLASAKYGQKSHVSFGEIWAKAHVSFGEIWATVQRLNSNVLVYMVSFFTLLNSQVLSARFPP
uniref:Uncharacterized protein n=1 Tax=Meloidogyne enterolobii TaxID=390850 RepID=A0A6V7W2M4_MELEN|nr:unnamed protein product [Meloidogyne enterolobii]